MGLVSGILEKPIPDSGPRGQKAPDPGSATLGLHCMGLSKELGGQLVQRCGGFVINVGAPPNSRKDSNLQI
jgi:hypothetical protein